MHPDWRPITHAVYYGPSQRGKSRHAHWCMRQHTVSGSGFMYADPKGEGYRFMERWLAFVRPMRRVWLLDFSAGDAAFDPFRPAPGADPGVFGRRMTDIAAAGWGSGRADTDLMPQFRETAEAVFGSIAVTGMPLRDAALALYRHNGTVREWILERLPDTMLRQKWVALMSTPDREWEGKTGSALRRLSRFADSKALMKCAAAPRPLDPRECLANREIVIANFAPNLTMLDADASRAAMAALAYAFLDAAMERAAAGAKPEHYFYTYLDEAQRWLPPEACDMLDSALGGGLPVTIIGHSPRQFRESNARLWASIEANCATQLWFGFPSLPDAKEFAELAFLSEVNRRMEKERIYVPMTVGHERVEEEMEDSAEAETEGESEREDAEGNVLLGSNGALTRSVHRRLDVRYLSVIEERLASIMEWSREDKIGMAAEHAMNWVSQPRRHWVWRGGKATAGETPELTEFLAPGHLKTEERVLEFRESRRQIAPPAPPVSPPDYGKNSDGNHANGNGGGKAAGKKKPAALFKPPRPADH